MHVLSIFLLWEQAQTQQHQSALFSQSWDTYYSNCGGGGCKCDSAAKTSKTASARVKMMGGSDK